MNTEPAENGIGPLPDLVWVARCYQHYKVMPYGPELRDLCEALDEMCEAIGVTSPWPEGGGE